MMARKKFPGSPASLDALCRRFQIDNSGRELHGALLDAQLLAEVYLELMGGRQHGFSLAQENVQNETGGAVSVQSERQRPFREPRPHAPSDDEAAAHDALLKDMKDPIWVKR